MIPLQHLFSLICPFATRSLPSLPLPCLSLGLLEISYSKVPAITRATRRMLVHCCCASSRPLVQPRLCSYVSIRSRPLRPSREDFSFGRQREKVHYLRCISQRLLEREEAYNDLFAERERERGATRTERKKSRREAGSPSAAIANIPASVFRVVSSGHSSAFTVHPAIYSGSFVPQEPPRHHRPRETSRDPFRTRT